MADNETSTIISVKDDTASGIRSAINNYSTLEKNLERLRRRNQSITDTPEEWKARGAAAQRYWSEIDRANKRAASSGEGANRVQKEHVSILKEVGGELAGMAAKYVGVAAVIDQAREGFVEFAKDQETLRIIGARMGATREQLEKFKETVDKIGHTFGDSFEKISSTMEAFRASANLTQADLGKIQTIAPAIMEVANRFGVESTELGNAFGSFVRQMNIAPAQWEQALGAMSMTTRGLNLDLGELSRIAPQLTENMQAIGANGMEGMKQTLALLGLAKGAFGSTTKSAMGLGQALNEIQSGGGVMSAMNMDAEKWSRETNKIKAEGGNLFEWYASQIRKAQRNHFEMGELFSNPAMRRFWEMYLSEGGKVSDMLSKIDRESKAFHSGHTDDLKNEFMAIKTLTHEWSEFGQSLGGVIAASGGGKFLEDMAEGFRTLTRGIEDIEALIKNFSWGKLAEEAPKLLNNKLFSLEFSSPHLPWNTPSKKYTMFGEEIKTNEGENHEHRAFGGSVKAGRTYQVGEKGTELFTASQSGNITSNDTIKNVERHTDDTNTLLTQIRDLMLKQVDDDSSGGGGSGGGGGDDSVTDAGGGNPVVGAGRVRGVTRGLARSMNAEGQGIAATDTANVNGSEYLVKERSGMKAEIDADPNLRRELRGMMSTEGTPLGSLESLANRTAYINAKRAKKGQKPLSLRQMLHSGFYGPINRGQLPGAMRATDKHPGKYDAAIDAVFDKGSNILEGATDQGMPSDPNGRTAIGGFRKRIGGNVFNDWGGGGSPMDAARWRIEQQKKVNSQPSTKPAESVPLPQSKPQTDPTTPMSSLEEARKMRAELEQPITIRTQMDRGSDSQFRRASMRRELNREVREAAWNSYSDIGAA